jgi:hypothetical protein
MRQGEGGYRADTASPEEVPTVFVSRYMPCELCGESVDRTAPQTHQCSPDRRAAFPMWAMRDEIDDFEDRYRSYLDTRQGEFDVWLAAREVRRNRRGGAA